MNVGGAGAGSEWPDAKPAARRPELTGNRLAAMLRTGSRATN